MPQNVLPQLAAEWGKTGVPRKRRTQTVVEAAHLIVGEHGHCRLGVVAVETSVAVALKGLFLDVWQESLGSARVVVGIVRGLLEGLGG